MNSRRTGEDIRRPSVDPPEKVQVVPWVEERNVVHVDIDNRIRGTVWIR